MKVQVIRTARLFEKRYKRLPKEIKEQAKLKEEIFRKDHFHPALRTHKLHGKDRDAWAFWVTRSYRIKFTFLADQEVLFLDIGTHDIYE